MKIEELIIEKEKEKKTPEGTYAAVKFNDQAVDQMHNFCNDNDIPNPLGRGEFHATLIYSKKHLPDFEPQEEVDWNATPIGFDVWKSEANSFKEKATYCLVMKLKCAELTDRFNYIMDNFDATYNFDEYIPHVTLSYDVGEDFDKKTLKWTGDNLVITSEYSEDLK